MNDLIKAWKLRRDAEKLCCVNIKMDLIKEAEVLENSFYKKIKIFDPTKDGGKK